MYYLIKHLNLLKGYCFFLSPTLGIYKCTFSHKKLGIPKEHLASKSLPHLVSLSIDNNLNLNQVLLNKTHTRYTVKLPANSLFNRKNSNLL